MLNNMTSMAATCNARAHFQEAFCKAEKKNVALGNAVFYRWRNNNVIKLNKRSFSVMASGISPQNIDTVNGKKVNGTNVGEAPFVGNKINEPAKQSDVDAPLHAILLGRFVEERFVYRQTFIIRSYEIGPDKTATMETLMNLLQVGSWFVIIYKTQCLCDNCWFLLICKVLYLKYHTWFHFNSMAK
jgi:fatty acyl-ACP thioesterase B